MVEGAWRWRERGWVGGDGEGRGGVELHSSIVYSGASTAARLASIPNRPPSTYVGPSGEKIGRMEKINE